MIYVPIDIDKPKNCIECRFHTEDGYCIAFPEKRDLWRNDCASMRAIFCPIETKVPDGQDKTDLRDCVNELCLKCGQYREAYMTACDGCRWLNVKERLRK